MTLFENIVNETKQMNILSLAKLGPRYLAQWVVNKYNQIHRNPRYSPPTDVDEYQNIINQSEQPSDISDHLPRLFLETIHSNPNTVVELGVRGGQSTKAFERAASICEADLISVDIDEAKMDAEFDGWHFVQADDIEFGEEFSEWCSQNDISSSIDVLFIDTSHLYEHTVEEINTWFPHLAQDATVIFHDTNMGRLYCRSDGTYGIGWDNNRGVIRAIEEFLDCRLDETERFTTIQKGFQIEHYPLCSGLTVLQKMPALREE